MIHEHTSLTDAQRVHPSVCEVRRALLSFALLPFGGPGPRAATEPRGSVRPTLVVVPYPSGGPVDAATRVIAAALSTASHKPMTVENKAGASGMIATEFVARSRADGHTLLVGNLDTFVLNVLLRKNIRYDPVQEFSPIGMLGTMPLVLVARSGLPVQTVRDVVRLARSAPGQLTYGSWGIGSLGHLAGLMMERSSGVSMLHIPFQGGAAAQTQLLANEIDLLVVQAPFALAMHELGRLTPLGLTSAHRSPLCPGVPTLAESGLTGFAADQWLALFAPAALPVRVHEALSLATAAILEEDDVKEKLAKVGLEGVGGPPAAVSKLLLLEFERWRPVIKDRAIQLD